MYIAFGLAGHSLEVVFLLGIGVFDTVPLRSQEVEHEFHTMLREMARILTM